MLRPTTIVAMQTLLRAAFHLSRARGIGTTRVAVLVDSDLGIDAGAVAALLRPWRSWLALTEIRITLSLIHI